MHLPGLKRIVVALLVAGCVVAALPGPASAAKLRKGFWGPSQVDGVSQFPIYEKLGVGIYQKTLRWERVAPTRPVHPTDPSDPAYRWPQELDFIMRAAQSSHMQVLLQISGSPPWANGGHTPQWSPNRDDYADFATAAARRYPAVHLWMVWGEPTRPENYQPLVAQTIGKPLTRRQRAAPHRYARLLDKAYGALKHVSKRNKVIGGNSFTAGDIRPKQWVRNLRMPNGRPPRMDLYGHNPFCLRSPSLKHRPGPQGSVDFSDLGRFQKVVDHYIGRRARGKHHRNHVRLFLSEWTVPTGPDREFNFYATRRTQARFITRGFRIARKLRVYGLGWIHLYDEPVPADGNRRSQGGLLTAGGKRKPGFRAFQKG